MNMVAGGTVGSRRDGIPAAFSGSGLVAYLTIQNTQEEAESEQHCYDMPPAVNGSHGLGLGVKPGWNEDGERMQGCQDQVQAPCLQDQPLGVSLTT
ncbi:hypothetical protein P7K49_002523 [Saguinus oedipus]|uniref:Uncharacterized protein n=1 Tax=Saguinus oedipus TaxID=9490 RepID=A0ABQ9WHJ9_SAGOE|nr:hypothetical protein P7K49_002523 [Saguinus oedipus]